MRFGSGQLRAVLYKFFYNFTVFFEWLLNRMKKSRNPPATSFRGDCGSKVRGYVRDLPGTYLVRVPGTVCHKALFVCEIKSPICFGFMPSLYLVKSASSARLFAGLQLLVLRFEQGYALQDERQGRMPRLAARRGKRVGIPWLYLLFCLSCREVTAFFPTV